MNGSSLVNFMLITSQTKRQISDILGLPVMMETNHIQYASWNCRLGWDHSLLGGGGGGGNATQAVSVIKVNEINQLK